jgi:hypothetical protein
MILLLVFVTLVFLALLPLAFSRTREPPAPIITLDGQVIRWRGSRIRNEPVMYEVLVQGEKSPHWVYCHAKNVRGSESGGEISQSECTQQNDFNTISMQLPPGKYRATVKSKLGTSTKNFIVNKNGDTSPNPAAIGKES